MIVSFKTKALAQIASGRTPKRFPADLLVRTRAVLLTLKAAEMLEDLRNPPGNRLESLQGDRAGQYSLRINQQWRICFVWTAEGPSEVEFVDYHK